MRVLLVEDNDGDADLVRDALTVAVNADIHLARVARIDAATAKLAGERFDVVLLDLSLPDAIGLEGLHRLRAAAPGAPIVVLTGSSDSKTGTLAMQNGAQDYLQKGEVASSELLRAIRYASERSQYADRVRLLAEVGIAVTRSLDPSEMRVDLETALRVKYADFCAFGGGQASASTVSHLYASFADVASDDPHRDVIDTLRAKGLTSAVIVPFSVDGGESGLFTCARRASSVPYGPADLALAEEIASRTVGALEHTGLLSIAKHERDRAEVALRSRDEFLATLSHELRTPLNAILGWTQMLREGKVAPAAQARALETIERNARSQAALIEDVLDVSRIITGKLRIRVGRIDVSAIVVDALESVRPAAAAKEIAVELAPNTGPPVTMQGDADRLLQVLWNLLSNAVKFTPRGGRVTLSVQESLGLIEIVVADNGQGIRSDFLPYVFERFRQADSSMTRAHGGLGLGLAITRSLVEAQGGTICVESDGALRGTRFIVTLPVTARHADSMLAPAPLAVSPSKPPPPLPPSVAGLRVLVVDDDPDTLLLLQMLLERSDAVVSTASSAESAFAAFADRPPDVLISDIGMPGESGYDLIRRIRELKPTLGGNVPAIAATAYARPEDRAAALTMGFDHHVTKPIDANELLAVVTSVSRRVAR